MKQYKTLSPFRDENGSHKPDDIVNLTDKDAEELIEIGAIEAIAAPVNRQAEIVAAIGKLDKENPELWLKDGKPDSNAIAAITGWPVAAAERDSAWATITAAAGS